MLLNVKRSEMTTVLLIIISCLKKKKFPFQINAEWLSNNPLTWKHLSKYLILDILGRFNKKQLKWYLKKSTLQSFKVIWTVQSILIIINFLRTIHMKKCIFLDWQMRNSWKEKICRKPHLNCFLPYSAEFQT